MALSATAHARRVRRVAGAFITTGTAFAAATLILIPSAGASSHREAPLIAGDPTVDNTDVWAFTSPDAQDTVTMIANWAPFSEPNGGPNFYPWAQGAHYDINVDNDGDAAPDLIYRWVFTTQDLRDNTFLYNNGPVTSLDDENLLFRQTYDLTVIDAEGTEQTLLDDAPAAPSNVGPASIPNYAALTEQAVLNLPGGGKSFAGQSDDAFFLDLRVFDLLYGGNLTEVGQDTLAGYNANTLAIQVPKSALALGGNAEANPVIGVWSDTEKQSMQLAPGVADPTGQHVQVSRLGSPLINEVVVPAPLKDAFNGSEPVSDAGNQALLDRVTTPEVPQLIQSIYGLPAPATPRDDLVEIFLTGITDKTGDQINRGPLNSQLDNADVDPGRFQPSEQLRLNMSTPVTAAPNRLGVIGGDLQGYPNGRRLADDVVDIEVLALQGAARGEPLSAALLAGDLVNTNQKPFLGSFPYVATANNQAVNTTGTPIGLPPGVPSDSDLPALPILPMGTGLGALALIGTGGLLWRRHPERTPAHHSGTSAVE
ncbi:MAG: DUF4331 domain-containing protein [Actinomycetota bacterium]|nr:DUF4331 domain-containing protein [Actinomycetota bacterium]